MKKKKLLLLGGLRYLLPVIEAAHKLDCHVITCDYLPDNIAHKYSDEYHNVSIIDKEAVLKLAKELQIDGIMSFAVDPGVITAAYVAEKMGLPSAGPYKSIKILQNKNLFRDFLRVNNFNVPKSISVSSYNDIQDKLNNFNWPLIVKPTDSAGSKGVTKINTKNELKDAIEYALQFSISKNVIIEEFIEKKGSSSDSDGFSVDGKLVACYFNRQYFEDESSNPYVPSAYSWPSTFTREQENILISEIQRLITLLDLKTSVYNIEVRVSEKNIPYIMELTPRGGGNRLSELIRYGTGVDFITNAVKGALGLNIDEINYNEFDGYWAEIILHSKTQGLFERLNIDEKYKENVIEEDLWVSKGDKINSFKSANEAIGTLVLRFDTQNEMEDALINRNKWLKVLVK